MPKVVFTPWKSSESEAPIAHDVVQYHSYASESIVNSAGSDATTDYDVAQHHSYASESIINSAGSENAQLLANLNNLATITGNQAAAEELSVPEKGLMELG